jgi:hypothetical protein
MRVPSSRLMKGKRSSSVSIAAPVQIAGHQGQVSVYLLRNQHDQQGDPGSKGSNTVDDHALQ